STTRSSTAARTAAGVAPPMAAVPTRDRPHPRPPKTPITPARAATTAIRAEVAMSVAAEVTSAAAMSVAAATLAGVISEAAVILEVEAISAAGVGAISEAAAETSRPVRSGERHLHGNSRARLLASCTCGHLLFQRI